MLDATTIEQRLASLEQSVSALQRQIPPKFDNWLDNLIGSVSDDEAFHQALEYGLVYRKSEQPTDDLTE